jgi:hypothetical protein
MLSFGQSFQRTWRSTVSLHADLKGWDHYDYKYCRFSYIAFKRAKINITRTVSLPLPTTRIFSERWSRPIAKTPVLILIPKATTTLVLGLLGSYIVLKLLRSSLSRSVGSSRSSTMVGIAIVPHNSTVPHSSSGVALASYYPAREIRSRRSPSEPIVCKRVCPHFTSHALASYDAIPAFSFCSACASFGLISWKRFN